MLSDMFMYYVWSVNLTLTDADIRVTSITLML